MERRPTRRRGNFSRQWDEAVRWQEQALSRQASAPLSLGWFELSARRFPASIAHSTEAFALDSTNTCTLPNLFNGLLLAGPGAQADSMFQVHARRQVEDPAVPFACAVVRDLETVLIPRGAARPAQLRHAEELAGRHSPSPLSQCPHRKIPPPTP